LRSTVRDRDGFRSLKSDTEDQLNEQLAESKRKSIVHNAMYHKIMDYVGFRAKDGQVLEPLLPTEYYVSYLYIETNRKEVQRLQPASFVSDKMITPICLSTGLRAVGQRLSSVQRNR
jgi:hypothetical protein